MHLFKNAKEPWEIGDLKVIELYKKSPIFQETNRPENVKLALFIARQEPAGLQSTFKTDEFNRVYGILSQKDGPVEK